ncbi:phage tail family protein [Paenibacillus chitinolyticus]|uniref:Phage tail family protein n=1 Tax=Paenibacillus chitinolyticus TaxID=79263 RepID=A0A410X0X1_9BACL|nr:distal tail protein Dit [Paenibacillus chitinolyticus]MCY9593718.1 phage tail family protein [Paenibacillus chitinolyticus]MCY9599716.1 phage tail family protein [Paenibacillus chitinolyticus]QAV20111.1 phage tail family protein [Paenibacillus chitinolyticus]
MIDATVNGVKFSDIGLGLIRHNIPVLPPTNDYTLEIAGRDGEINFGSSYQARTFELECVVMANDPTLDYHAKIANIAGLFNAKRGELEITFSDLPGRRYMARYAGSMEIEKLLFDGNVTIPLKMDDPYVQSLYDTKAKEYGQGLEYGQLYEYSDYSVQISSSSQSFTIRNTGNVDAAPTIRISGAFTNLSLSDGHNVLTITDTCTASDVYEIDGHHYTVKKNGINAYAKSNGVFFTIPPGATTFISTATNPDFKVEVIFRHKYLY